MHDPGETALGAILGLFIGLVVTVAMLGIVYALRR